MGGGSGGHITPIAAVVSGIKDRYRKTEIRVWCDRKFSDQARKLLGSSVRVDVIVSGKWRRYANISLWSKLRYHIFRTYLRNFLDLFKVAFATIQSYVKLIIWRPDVIFIKGGFVCLPVGLAARMLKIPIVIHDSDTIPGLTNRILSRFATAIGVGSPADNYPNYRKEITKFVGVPVREKIHEYTVEEQKKAKEKLGFDANKKLILVVGGGLGAVVINENVVNNTTPMIENNAQILLVAGKGNVERLNKPESKNIKIVEFLSGDYLTALAAGDIVVTRAGATTMAELSAAGKAVIIVPNKHLAGDHQTKNAMAYKKSNAAIVVDQDEMEQNPEILADAILKLLNDAKLCGELSQNLAKFSRPNALNDIIDMILRCGRGE